MAKRKLSLEKTKRGYEVVSAKFVWLGDVIMVERNGKKRWVFKACGVDEYTPNKLEQIAKLVRGLE